MGSMGAMLILSKIVAIRFGPDGVGYQGGFVSVVTVVAGFALLGTTSSLPTFHAASGGLSRHALRRVVAGVVLPACMVSLPLLALLTVPAMAPPFRLDALCVGAVLAFASSVWSPLSRTMLSIFDTPKQVAKQQVFFSVAAAAVGAVLVEVLGFEFLPLSLGMGLFVGQMAASALIRVTGTPQAERGSESLLPASARSHLLRQTLPIFFSVAASQLAFSALPFIVLSIASGETAGLFRAALTWGILPFTLLSVALIYAFLPRLAAGISDRDKTISAMEDEASAVLRLGSLGSMILCFCAPILLMAAFTPEFVSASSALVLIAMGSLPRLLAAVNTTLLVAASQNGPMLGTEWTMALFVMVFCGFASLTDSAWLIAGAFLCSCVLGLVTSEVITRRAAITTACSSLSVPQATLWIGVLIVTGLVTILVFESHLAF